MKKIIAMALTAVMVLGMSTMAMAAASVDSGKGGPASIIITLPKDNAGTNEDITYTVYKVFDATNDGTSSAISYKIDAANGDLTTAMTDAGFAVDPAGNVSGPTSLDDTAIAAIAAYAKDSIGTFTAKPSQSPLEITGLQYGYYYITTTTGTVVTIDSTNPEARVQDKNTIPNPPVKKIVEDFEGCVDEAGKNAIAQVGTTVPFSVDIVKVKGATNYVFHDTMTAGLTYQNDVKVYVNGTEVPAANYDKTVASGDTVTVTFDNDWLAGLADDTTITITYSAKVNSDALSIDYANNTATLSYGNNYITKSDNTKVYNAKLTVTKSDGNKQPLAGAGFIIQSAGGGYYKIDNMVVSWVATSDEATEYKSDATGAVPAFTGLANGTYTLIEKTVPAGYNKAADLPFTIAEDNYEIGNLEKEANVINNSGTELPATGGIGTTIFYALGAILVLGAGVLLVSKRRAA